MGLPGWAARLADGGKYNAEALDIMIDLKADGVALIVINGVKGNGATVHFLKECPRGVRKAIGKALIEMGKDIRRDAFGIAQ